MHTRLEGRCSMLVFRKKNKVYLVSDRLSFSLRLDGFLSPHARLRCLAHLQCSPFL